MPQSSEGRDARQENAPFSKPLPSRLEEHPRPVSSIPGARLQPRFELGASFRKLLIFVRVLPAVRMGTLREQVPYATQLNQPKRQVITTKTKQMLLILGFMLSSLVTLVPQGPAPSL